MKHDDSLGTGIVLLVILLMTFSYGAGKGISPFNLHDGAGLVEAVLTPITICCFGYFLVATAIDCHRESMERLIDRKLKEMS